jgi:hypothetical protein
VSDATFTPPVVREILAKAYRNTSALPSPEIIDEVAGRLNEAEAEYHHERYWAERPSASDMTTALRSIEANAAGLLKSLRLANPDDPSTTPDDVGSALRAQAAYMGEEIGGYRYHPPENWKQGGSVYVDYHPDAQLRDVIEGIMQLREWASRARARASARIKPAISTRNKGKVAEQALFGIVADIWISGMGKFQQPRLTNQSGRYGGSMFRFVRSIYDLIEVSASDGSIAERIRSKQEAFSNAGIGRRV